jgi:hypothetical protein
VYLNRFQRAAMSGHAAQDITYLRFAFCGTVGSPQSNLQLDDGIVRTVWLTPQEVRDSAHRHRSPLVVQCMEDYLNSQRYPLAVVLTDSSVVL